MLHDEAGMPQKGLQPVDVPVPQQVHTQRDCSPWRSQTRAQEQQEETAFSRPQPTMLHVSSLKGLSISWTIIRKSVWSEAEAGKRGG